MGKYKVLCFVFLGVLSFHVRGLQSRSTKDDRSEPKIYETVGKLKEWNTKQCLCFHKPAAGIPVSKYFPNDDRNRLVVYFYKQLRSNEVTAYIPNSRKQSIFPDLTFEVGDKLETLAPDRGFDILDNKRFVTYPKNPNIVENIGPDEGANHKINLTYVSDLVKDSTSDSHKKKHIKDIHNFKPIAVGVPSGKFTLSTVLLPSSSGNITFTKPSTEVYISPEKPPKPTEVNNIEPRNELIEALKDKNSQPIPTVDLPITLPPSDHKKTGVTRNPETFLEYEHKPITDATIYPNGESSHPLTDRNQLTQDNIYTELLGKPASVDDIIVIPSLENSSKLALINRSQELYTVYDNLNEPIGEPTSKFMKYNLPKYASLLPSLINQSMINNSMYSGWLDIANPNRSYDIRNLEYLQKKYDHPTFNEWFNHQMISLRLKRPSMFYAINLHSLRLLLIKSLHDNGIHVSVNGSLYNCNGNIKITNLELRPILLSDPMAYEKLVADSNCIIPYNMRYLEAVLITLVYPPRILSIIPLLGLKNNLIFGPHNNIFPNCSQPKHHTHETVRSSLPMEEEPKNDLDYDTQGNYKHLYKSRKEPRRPENDPIHLNAIVSKDNYLFSQSPMKVSPESSTEITEDEELTNNDNNKNVYKTDFGKPMKSMYFNDIAARNDYSYLHDSLSDETPEVEAVPNKNREQTNLMETFTPNAVSEDNNYDLQTTEGRSGEPGEEEETINFYDTPSKDDIFYVLDNHPDQPPSRSGQDDDEQAIYLDDANYLEERKPFQDFNIATDTAGLPDDKDSEILLIRIIGGNPAISSGTPVNSKGRSGLDY